MRLILASASPRRAEILHNANIGFEVRTALVDESRRAAESPADYVRRLALEKASAAMNAKKDDGDCLYLGADTIVLADGEVLGKPESDEEARMMLRRLSGAVHEVHTGVALLRRPVPAERVIVETTRVHFAQLSEEDIDSYLASGEPFDKAGAYAIQGIAGRYIDRIEGCYFNVVGLPLARIWSLMRELGWEQS